MSPAVVIAMNRQQKNKVKKKSADLSSIMAVKKVKLSLLIRVSK